MTKKSRFSLFVFGETVSIMDYGKKECKSFLAVHHGGTLGNVVDYAEKICRILNKASDDKEK